MTAVQRGPCSDWATTADLCSPCDDYAVDAAIMADMLTAASEILYVASGRQFPGACSTTVEIVRGRLAPHQPGDPAELRSATVDGRVSSGAGYRRRGLAVESRLTLGVFPIRSVTAVRINGSTVDAGDYRVDDWRHLVRVNGSGDPVGWESGTIAVDVSYGLDPPQMGVLAAADLACELYKSCQPETFGDCRLPKRVQTITRQGVSMALLDPLDFLEQGRTGLYLPDLFISTYNPANARRGVAIASPDVPVRSRHVNT